MAALVWAAGGFDALGGGSNNETDYHPIRDLDPEEKRKWDEIRRQDEEAEENRKTRVKNQAMPLLKHVENAILTKIRQYYKEFTPRKDLHPLTESVQILGILFVNINLTHKFPAKNQIMISIHIQSTRWPEQSLIIDDTDEKIPKKECIRRIESLPNYSEVITLAAKRFLLGHAMEGTMREGCPNVKCDGNLACYTGYRTSDSIADKRHAWSHKYFKFIVEITLDEEKFATLSSQQNQFTKFDDTISIGKPFDSFSSFDDFVRHIDTYVKNTGYFHSQLLGIEARIDAMLLIK